MTRETYDMLEERIQQNLEMLDTLEGGVRKSITDETARLVELLIAADKEDAERYDKQERRRIDEDRNKATAEVEMSKQEITWKRVGLEMAKLIVPLSMSMAGYDFFQKRMIKFEETGRFTSAVSRELHLPNFFKK